MGEPIAPESWYIPRRLSGETLRLLTELPEDEIRRRLRSAPVPDDRQPSEEELLLAMPRQFRDDLITVTCMAASGELYIRLNAGAVEFARAVLARWGNQQPRPIDEPAVPEGREPAAVEGQSSDQEVAKLVKTLKGIAFWRRCGKPGDPEPAPFDIRQADRLDRAAVLLEQLSASHPLRPIPVSERLPGPGDCDEHGRCWLWAKVGGDWRLIDPVNSGLPRLHYGFSHWLPANALPLPEAQP